MFVPDQDPGRGYLQIRGGQVKGADLKSNMLRARIHTKPKAVALLFLLLAAWPLQKLWGLVL
jgi:hypothetical protein